MVIHLGNYLGADNLMLMASPPPRVIVRWYSSILTMQNELGFALKFISYTASKMINEHQKSGNILRRIMGPPRNWISWLGVIGQNHSLGAKYWVGVRCSNYNELKKLYFMGALDAAKTTCREQAGKALQRWTAEHGQRRGNGLCQLVYWKCWNCLFAM